MPRRRDYKSLIIKVLAILVVISMIVGGFVVLFYK